MLSAIQGTQERHTNRLGELAVKVDGLEIKVDTLDGKVDGLDAKVDTVDGRFDSLETQVRTLGGKIDTVLTLLTRGTRD